MHNFTSTDLLLYVLNELDEPLSKRIETHIAHHPALQKEVEDLRLSLSDLNSLTLEPNPKSIKVVLNQLHETDAIQIV
jgi:hypothetical protein